MISTTRISMLGSSVTAMMMMVITILSCSATTDAWISSTQHYHHIFRQAANRSYLTRWMAPNSKNNEDIMDAEFEKTTTTTSTSTTPPKKKKKRRSFNIPMDVPENFDADDDDDDKKEEAKSLIDMSLDTGDEGWKKMRVPFCQEDEYIDGKLTFTADIEGMTYGIAVPFDDAVAVVLETPKNGKVHYFSPENYESDEDGQELMEMMAAQVKKELGEEYDLRKTPRVLTVSGDLSQYTDQWKKKVVPEPASVDDLLGAITNGGEDELEKMMAVIAKDMGEEKFQQVMTEEISDETKEMAKFFDVPTMEDLSEDPDAMESMFQSMMNDFDAGDVKEAEQFEVDTKGMSLKLVSFNFADGKSYSLVKLLDPFLLVGKYNPMDGKTIRFELLSKEEEQLVYPKLERLCKNDLEAAGLDKQFKSKST